MKTKNRKEDASIDPASAKQPPLAKTSAPFPPLSTSLENFLDDGSDRDFRELIYGLLSVSSNMLKAREHFATHISVTAPQFNMIVAIGEAGDSTVTRLADKLHVSSPFVTAEINKLIDAGLVEKHKNLLDGRSMLLRLTDEGRERVRDVGAIRQQANDILFGSLTKTEARQFAKIISTLLVDSKRTLHALEAISDLKSRPEWRPPIDRGIW